MTDVYKNDSPEWKLVRANLDKALADDKSNCDLEDEMVAWYHGKISRTDAEQTLTEASNRSLTENSDGMFLVRDSTSSDVAFSLSLLHNEKYYHFYIHCSKEGYYCIDGGPSIHGLEKLIEHYTKDADKLPTCLTMLCAGRIPPATARRNGPTNILHRAVTDKQQDIVMKILDHPMCPDMNAKNAHGSTALHEAAAMGLDKTVSHLLHKGADIRIKDCDGHTPLHRACAANRGAICVQIISYDSSCLLEKNPMSGCVPLHVAAMHGHLECVEVLLNSKAPVFPRDLNDETPVELAEKYRRNRCIQILENKSSAAADTDEDFFHPELDRQGAETLVKDHFMTDGLFVIRKSKSVENQNVLSLCHSKGVLNYEIKSKMYRGRRVHSIDSGPYHPSLLQLVQYYHYFAEGTPVKLQAYVSRDGRKVAIDDTDVYCNLSSGSKPQKLLPKLSHKKRPAPIPTSTGPAKPERRSQPPPSEPESPLYRTPPTVSPLSTPLNGQEDSENFKEIPLKNIKKGSKLGEGEYGSVLKGVLTEKAGLLRKDKRTEVAIKTFHSVGSMEDFKREAHVMQSLHNEFIVELLGVCQGPPLMLIEEFMPKGSMLDFLEDHPKQVRVKEELYLWAAQIAMGMTYLETQSLVHRDLAARNILLKSLQHVKISDFGLSRAMGSDKEYYKASKGGRWPIKWYAPESVNFGHFSHASDVWSYGVTLWEMFTYGQAPFENMSGVEVIKFIEDGRRLIKPEKCTPEVYSIMTRCWSLKAEDRPTFTALSGLFDEDPEYVSTKETIAAIKSRRM